MKKFPLKQNIIRILLAALLFVTAIFAGEAKAEIPAANHTSSYSAVVNTAEGIREIFPESYWSSLEALLSAHPNWKFRAFYTGLTWDECFTEESELYPTRNLTVAKKSDGTLYYPSSWYSTEITGAYSWAGNAWTGYDSGNWYQSAEEAIKYCMDPRNFFTEEQIFQFMDNASALDPEVSAAAVSNIFSTIGVSHWTQSGEALNLYYEEGSEKHYLTYAEAVNKVCTELNVNQIIVASRIRQEHAAATSPLISGTRSFTLSDGTVINGGYYNYFDIEAGGTGDEIITNGLREAYKEGWTTRYKSIYGGAQKYMKTYIDRGQTTLYSQKFNVDSSSSRLFWGQYMQNLTAPQTECRSVYNSIVAAGALDSDFTFVIPVYSGMPDTPSPEPTKDGNPNYKIGSIYVNGSALEGFDADKTEYSVVFSNTVSEVSLNVLAYASTSTISVGPYSSKGSLSETLNVILGDNVYNIVCTAENGDSRTYTIKIHRDGEVVYGDVNSDDVWDIKDVAIIGSHITGKITLTGSALEAADINGDGIASIVDVAFLGAYITGKISEVPQRSALTEGN